MVRIILLLTAFLSADNTLLENKVAFQYHNYQIIVPVMIGNNGPYNFIYDTGVYPSMISRTVAIENKLKFGKLSGSLLGFGDGSTPFAYSEMSDVSVGSAKANKIETLVCEIPYQLEEITIDGVLGHDFIRHFVSRIDYNNCTISISKNNPEGHFKDKTKGLEYIQLPLKLAGGKIPIVRDFLLNDLRLTAWLDTGCGAPVVLTQSAAHRAGLRSLLKEAESIEGGGTRGKIQFKLIRHQRGQIKSIKQDSVAVLVFDSGGQNTIGNAYMDSYIVTFDYLQKQVYFENN